MINNKWSK